MKKRRFVSMPDFVIVLIIALIAAALYFAFNMGVGGTSAEILADNKAVKRLDLSQDGEYTLEGYEGVVFTVKDGAAAFTVSDCPDKICVRTGFIKNKGQSAVCLPNKLTLRITGRDEIDAYVG